MFSSPYSPFFTSGLLSTHPATSKLDNSADLQDAEEYLSFLSLDTQVTEQSRSTLPKKPVPASALPSVPVRQSKRRNTTSRCPPCASTSNPLQRRDTTATRSTASTGYRRMNRSDALAILEGREGDAKRIPRRTTRPPPRRSTNFMNFADDEDEQSSADESSNDEASIDDDDDDRDSLVKLLPTYSYDDKSILFSPVGEDGVSDAVVPLPEPKVSSISKPALKRRSTISDWLPMQSFMDLKSDSKDDETSQWGWRSFMEIAAKN